ncbi:MAG: flagellar hook-basal body complex protein, partial [Gammaproteobacteria bacterium]|nr:flagellar hook-basal body complex protein [Gammaproteobacteria bacterium]
MAFGIALSGIDAAQSDLNVTANNIANSATTGFKSSTSEFAELFAVSPQGVSNAQTGNGVKIAQVAQKFTQGNITSTG